MQRGLPDWSIKARSYYRILAVSCLVAGGPFQAACADSSAGPGSAPVAAAQVDSILTPPEFVRIAPGTFVMGSPPDEPGRFTDETQHRVTLTNPFYLCDHLVTQAEWLEVMGWDESQFTGNPERPVENVSWFDCVEYCNLRSREERLTPVYTITDRRSEGNHLVAAYVTWDRSADGYRLPTDAEWEYTCRAGTTTAFYNGPITVHGTSVHCMEDPGLDEISWYCATAGGRTHDVRTLPPNSWGLYDMAGNVQEWCWDWFDDLTDRPATDPAGPGSGFLRVWRGGGWNYDARHCRSAQRGRDEPSGWYFDLGIRVCRNAP